MFRTRFEDRWKAEGGYRELLAVAVPLIVSYGSLTAQQFIDSIFLSRFDPSGEHLAAVVPASNLNYMIFLFFMGTAGYVNTFVAQYYGARRYERIGRSVWQGIYFGLIAGAALLGAIPLARPFIDLVAAHHEPAVRDLEAVYFRTMFFAGPFLVVRAALSAFFSGRGRTVVIMWVSLVGLVVNVSLNYIWIFGHLGFPQWGMFGAALGTVASIAVEMGLYATLFLCRSNRRRFGTLSQWRPEADLFRRLIRYGMPAGFQIFLNVMSFALFMIIIGRLGTAELAATSLAFRIETFAFMPMLGMSFAVSVLVGRRLTENRADLAAKTTWSGAHMATLYVGVVALLFVIVPNVFIRFYGGPQQASFAAIAATARPLLRFVAVYSLFNAGNLVFNAALRGAGDTRFVAAMALCLSWGVMVGPSVAAVYVFESLYLAWTFITLYSVALAIAFFWRYQTGKWKRMRVIEDEPVPLAP